MNYLVGSRVEITVGNFKGRTAKVTEYRAQDQSYLLDFDEPMLKGWTNHIRWFNSELKQYENHSNSSPVS